MLAVLKAGRAYLPLSLGDPPDRLRFILDDCQAQLVLTAGEELPGELAAAGLTVVDCRAAAEQGEGNQVRGATHPVKATDLAYVMYTSGSTGQPKGVAVPHRAVVRLVRGQDYADFSPGRRFLFFSSTAFDASTFELWGPLLNGATCVVYPQRLPDFRELERFIAEQKIDTLWLTAGLLHQLIDQRPTALATVQHVLAGGDVLSAAHLRRLHELYPALRITNGYGPTESTTFACTCDVTAECDLALLDSVPIGRPIAHTLCYVLDQNQQPVPDGGEGEFYIGGDGLARGYVNRPELTELRFLPDPFSDRPEARMYRTGDRVRRRSDGLLEFLGRQDRQVKIRGFRVELAEVEAAINAHPDVKACAALAVGQQELSAIAKQLVAFVATDSSQPSFDRALRHWLADRVPQFLVPARIFTVSELPLNANGKVDYRELERRAAVDGLSAGLPAASAGPRDQLERDLLEIWREVLERELLGVQDRFLDVGGNSLQAMVLAAACW